MNLVDSSGWLEYYANGANASFFAPSIENSRDLLVSTINIYEVFKLILRQRGEDAALSAISHMKNGTVVEVTEPIALSAAVISHNLKMPMADSLLLATAREYQATLWTQDIDFASLVEVKYVAKR